MIECDTTECDYRRCLSDNEDGICVYEDLLDKSEATATASTGSIINADVYCNNIHRS